MLNGLDLFSGIGGISYALQDYIRPVSYCEIEPYCQSVLLQRMQAGDLSKAPIWNDVRSLTNTFPHGIIDIIYGGFPCQDISIAGVGRGLEGERSGLFFEIMRLAKEVKPKFIFLENVPAITGRGGLQVVREVTEMGYDCRWCVISAAGVGALHRRERWFLLAHSKHNGESASQRGGGVRECTSSREGSEEQKEMLGETERASGIPAHVANSNRKQCQEQWGESVSNEPRQSRIGDSGEDVANTTSESADGYTLGKKKTHSLLGDSSEDDCNTDIITSEQTNTRSKSKHTEWEARGEHSRLYRPFKSRDDWQATVSDVCRVTDGVSCGVDRLKSLGNAVVPQQVRKAWEILSGKTYR